MIDSGYDKVFTITDYYDGARAGVADFDGQPHYYECQFDELKDDWSDIFLLKPIDSETFRLAMEDWHIWEKWNAAYEDQKVSLDTHPALPEDRVRHNEISTFLKDRLKADAERDIKAKATFKIIEPKRKGKSIARLQVKWSVIS
jgi:hypothetical protein